MQVRETLHANALAQKKRQLRSVEAQLAAKRNENATLALHLAGEQLFTPKPVALPSCASLDERCRRFEEHGRTDAGILGITSA
jgi:hypothetical protein